ncbi:hypothetical protein BU23DRAFT_572181 [Bimuria novae-zelandiae CBS 107.79]|uniref:Uncharacterized protein n=1 Tax=Bimuria novae-zelandiae CBS 107.79 TaxID=1447943 RepID=A0A6A5UUV7_9PLEO|nr:hypothetical protein BU23DRAFT_572181 [Bimuria novae-zelandiae CBS 107.79]
MAGLKGTDCHTYGGAVEEVERHYVQGHGRTRSNNTHTAWREVWGRWVEKQEVEPTMCGPEYPPSPDYGLGEDTQRCIENYRHGHPCVNQRHTAEVTMVVAASHVHRSKIMDGRCYSWTRNASNPRKWAWDSCGEDKKTMSIINNGWTRKSTSEMLWAVLVCAGGWLQKETRIMA